MVAICQPEESSSVNHTDNNESYRVSGVFPLWRVTQLYLQRREDGWEAREDLVMVEEEKVCY